MQQGAHLLLYLCSKGSHALVSRGNGQLPVAMKLWDPEPPGEMEW